MAHYEHDIFVSYAHKDNIAMGSDDPSDGWVWTLVSELTKLMDQKLGREGPCKIWLDRGLRGNEPVTPEIQNAVGKTALLQAILSRGYLDSKWCTEERDLFLEASGGPGGAADRIFVVCHSETDRDEWPEPFGDLLGYQFHQREHPGGPARTLGMPRLDPNDKLYFQRLDDLSRELADRLGKMKMEAQGTPPPSEPLGPVVFVAETTPDMTGLRDGMVRYLIQAGFRVRPEGNYSRSPLEYREAMDRDLRECSLFVQLLGPYWSARTTELPSGYEGLQLELAKAAGVKIMQWRSLDLDLSKVTDAEHRAMLEGEEVAAMRTEEFKRRVEEKARRIDSKPDRPGGGEEPYVLLSADEADLPVAERFGRLLSAKGVAYEIARNGAALAALAEEEDYDALMILYGTCRPGWVAKQAKQWRKVMVQKKHQAPVGAIYVLPGDSDRPLWCRPPKFHVLTDAEEAVLDEFVELVQARRDGR